MADQYDALRSKRACKAGLSHKAAAMLIAEGDGRTMPGHFDPIIHGIFLEHQEKFQEIYETLQDGESDPVSPSGKPGFFWGGRSDT